ncbi:MAG: hypothetical protein Q9O62_07335 [Ardenticatenia bacterium]|nr:hypothetical protein [Ardenticatenia bacterium]
MGAPVPLASAAQPARRSARRTRELAWLLILVATVRLGTLLLLRPGGFVYDFSDYGWYRQMAQFTNEGFYPFVDFWMEYPPIFPWLNVALYRLSLLMPPAFDARLWHHWLLGLTLLPFDLGVLVLLHHIASATWGPDVGTWCAATWSTLFVPLYTWAGWFDSMAVFLYLLAVWLIVRERPLAAGVTLGVGFMVKISPILPLVVAVQRFRPSGRSLAGWLSPANRQVIGGLAVTVALLSAPWVLTRPDLFLVTFKNIVERSSWETVWALIDGYYGYGVVSAERFVTTPTLAVHPRRIPSLAVLAAGVLVGFWFWTRPWSWKRASVQVAFHALTLAIFLLVSPGWSPQFLLWVLPWVLLLTPFHRPVGLGSVHVPLAVWIALTFTALNVLELLYFHLWTTTPAILSAIIITRTGLLAWIAWAAYATLRATDSAEPFTARPPEPIP